jgi:hypothetical protein
MKITTKIIEARFRRRSQLRALRSHLLSEARKRHAEELKTAFLWRRLWLNLIIEYEVWKKMHDPSHLRVGGMPDGFARPNPDSDASDHNDAGGPTAASAVP